MGRSVHLLSCQRAIIQGSERRNSDPEKRRRQMAQKRAKELRMKVMKGQFHTPCELYGNPRVSRSHPLVSGRAPALPHSQHTRVMDGEEEESWLSSVISQVDRLALRIGGYEEERTG